MATETVSVNGARVKATTRYQGTRTGGAGCPNLADYTIQVAGHTLSGTWNDDARCDIEASVANDHPLAAALKLIRRAQRARHDYVEAKNQRIPAGWEWQYEGQEEAARADWSRARAAVRADPLAESIAAW